MSLMPISLPTRRTSSLNRKRERLHQAHLHLFRQAAHVVVALDGGGRAVYGYGLDHVRVNGALAQEVDIFQLGGFLLEYPR